MSEGLFMVMLGTFFMIKKFKILLTFLLSVIKLIFSIFAVALFKLLKLKIFYFRRRAFLSLGQGFEAHTATFGQDDATFWSNFLFSPSTF